MKTIPLFRIALYLGVLVIISKNYYSKTQQTVYHNG